MPVLLDRIDGTGINCLVWVGVVSRAEALRFPGLIDAAAPQFGGAWISYFHPAADLSDLDAGCLLELRERLRPIVSVLSARGDFRMILVSNSRYNDPLLDVWRTMAGTDPGYASNPLLVKDVAAAARALDLSAADTERVRQWIRSRTRP